MLYVIYNLNTDINDMMTMSVTSALERAGELVDIPTDIVNSDLYFVYLFDMTEDEYNDAIYVSDDDVIEKYTLRDFIQKYGISQVPEFATESFHNLDQNEQLEVLKYIPDHMLIGELRRRFDEYRRYADAIRDVGNRLRLYV